MKYFGFIAPVLKRLRLEASRDDQDLVLSLNQPTSNKARVDQDLSLTLNQPTSSKARVDQDLTLTLNQSTGSNARTAQDITLVLVHIIPATELLAFTIQPDMPRGKRRSQGLFAQASTPVFISNKAFPIVFCVT